MKVKAGTILIIIGVIVLLFGLGLFDGLGINIGGGGGSGKQKVTCSVTVDNDLLSKADITDYSCSTSKCGLFSISPFGIISQKFNIVLDVGGESVTKGISLRNDPFGDEQTYSISKCTSETASTGSITVYDEDGVLQDSVNINF